MKVQIIGLGVVGKAQAFLCKKLGHDVYGYDVNSESIEYVKKVEKPIDADLTFICIMESEVEDVIQMLMAYEVQGLYVVKSTTPIGTVQRLMEKYQIHICHNPEFLREKYAFEDVINPSRIVIGQCCNKHGELLAAFYSRLTKEIYITNPQTSELIKLVSNSLRAINISFWNELYILCQKVGADIKILAEASDAAKVLGEWEGGKWGTRFFGRPYGGKCLPKDVKHLINAFVRYGLDPTILEGVEKVNEMMKCLK